MFSSPHLGKFGYSSDFAVSDIDTTPPPDPEARRSPSEVPRSRAARALRLSPLFDRAARSTRDAAAAAATSEVVPGGTILFEQGAPVDALVILGRGRARVERSAAGGTVPLGYRGSGDALGESCLGGHDTRTERAVAMEEAEIIRVPIALARDLLAADPVFGGAVLTLLVARQREIEDRIESMLFRNVEGRLAEFLLKAADRWGVPTPRGILISAPLTHFEIAQVIGSTRETVTLTLGALRREGLLDVAGRRLIIREREALAQRQ
jgi:CRP-like cAMP-binding protein